MRSGIFRPRQSAASLPGEKGWCRKSLGPIEGPAKDLPDLAVPHRYPQASASTMRSSATCTQTDWRATP